MDKFLIKGPCKVKGSVNISGSKNGSLAILAATLLFDEPVELKNIPNVRDTNTFLDLLRSLNKKIVISKDKKKIKIYNSKKKISTFCNYAIVKQMRASILALGGLISKYRKAVISAPGGCAIGTRPINYHLNALKKLGMKFTLKGGYIHATAKNGLKGNTEIKFKSISVGATENLILASTLCNGTVTLHGCAIEPEVQELVDFLNNAGANIKWKKKRTLKIVGVKKLNSISYSIMGDRIEAATWCVLAVLTGGKLKINGLKNIKLIKTELDTLRKIGALIKYKENKIEIQGKKKLKKINITTKEYPGFCTDLGPQFGILLCKATGRSTITENIFENRFMWIAEARRLGAKIYIKGNKAIIEGNTKFQGAELMSSDLRASAALVIAGVEAKGRTVINRIYHCLRGYENFDYKLRKIGVKIKRVS